MTDGESVATIEHPMLVDGMLERRRYQLQLAGRAMDGHTLVCLPTGLGKTAVSLVVTARRLHEVGGKALLLAPTKPLVEQHAEFYREALEIPDEEIVVFTGKVRPDDRAELWEDARVVIATPQVVENDLIGNRIDLADVTHLTFDECHRGTGDYAYVYIAERYHEDAEQPLVTGMSASPGGDEEEILTVCANLGLRQVEVMTEDDADVDRFTHDTDVEWDTVELPEELIEIRDALADVIEERLERLRELGVTKKRSADLSQRDLNELRGKLQNLIDQDKSEGYEGMSIHAEIMKLRRALEVVETQSIEAVERYFERQRQQARSSGASKASQRFVSDPTIREAIRRVEDFDERHPKFREAHLRLAETLGIEDGERAIVFTESRDTAEVLTEFLGEHFDTRRFVGQGDKDGSDGMTQKEQQETLDAFRAGEFEVLVSTSVAEEGLDVPEVDLVLFYEPVPTAIRSIQRKGRTGRQAKGKVVVLMAEDTRDEAFFWIAKRREEEMADELAELKAMTDELDARLEQAGLDAFATGDAPEAVPAGGAGATPEIAESRTGDGSDDGSEEGSDETPVSTGPSSTEGLTDETAEKPAADGVRRASDGAGSDGKSQASDGGEAEGQADLGSFDASDDAEDGSVPDDTTPHATAETEGFEAVAGSEAAVDETEGDEDEREGTVAAPDPEADAIEVVIDQRELESSIARDLSRKDEIETRLETLAVGDYVCSDRVAVERKTVEDFLDTLLGGDRSLFEQAGDLTRHYERSVVILEGEGVYERRDVHPNAIRGALTSLAVDYGLSIMHSDDPDETVELLATIAGREQADRDREVSVHGEKQSKTLGEQQEYVVASIAEIGPVTARALLAHFGSVRDVMTADEEELLEVDGVGQVTVERILEVVTSEYTGQ
ncbi:Hef nuclease [Salinarchaeum sp. Harcht-Bsk1]|uniref:ERCC4 domain-containing protein n=1 Tax=Salinarchaeum sp. Harcht-Bsk1 TaxID=1333523 RepID=UPI0003424864|nr:ERCC4 domain-containing protein [Salinarchaeum sp. Harcht-Bsk1]AGN01070.1 Hef nuclease [Salinarchaeum sp. Harcht-Bsk1]